MLLEIEDDVFRDDHSGVHVPLLHIILGCDTGRHNAIVVPTPNHVVGWVAGQSPQVSKLLKGIFEASGRAVALARPRTAIRIVPIRSNYALATPEVEVNEARILVAEPFRIFVEDEFSDRDFILSYCTIPQRLYVESRERSRALLFEHGAGSRLFDRLERFISRFRRPDLLCAAVFDSDAWEPGKPSQSSEKVRELCRKNGIYCLQLSRRTMENYLTKSALNAWTYASAASKKSYHAVFQAFLSLSVPQRSHYNMRGGFSADASTQDRTAGSLYNNLSVAARTDLMPGFGKAVTDCFTKGWVRELDARRDGTWGELAPHIDALQQLIS